MLQRFLSNTMEVQGNKITGKWDIFPVLFFIFDICIESYEWIFSRVLNLIM